MKYIVDRIEDKYAVCEDEKGNMINIPLLKFESLVRENDVVEYVDNSYKVLKLETIKRKKYIEDIAKDMWEN